MMEEQDMRILMIECTAEELRANRTVMDNITEALSSFTRNLCGVDLSGDQIEKAMENMDEEEENDEV